MKFETLIKLVGDMACFDLQLLVQALDEKREAIRVQLSRFMKQGRVIPLRRGMYTLADIYRHTALVPAVLANNLYRPSYLSGLWALEYYDLIPETVIWLTSVTPRVPRRFENKFGIFEYRNIRQSAFFGYLSAPYGGADILVARAEKALLDHWHLEPGEWTEARLIEMRYQNIDTVDKHRLAEYAERFASPRLKRAAKLWSGVIGNAESGAVTL
jgi:predicted transcriptional regulator of viral defense system